MTEILRPFADLEGIFRTIEYRANAVDGFERIDIDGDSATKVVRVDDLRTIPAHQLKVHLNMDLLKPHYDKHDDKLRLVLIARDTTLRREVRLGDFALSEIPEPIDLDRALLRTTSLRDRLTVNLAIVLNQKIKGSAALPVQRASRLAEVAFTLKTNALGATFPFKRVSDEQFRVAEKPSETALHLDLICAPEELLQDSDTPISNLLTVWVHEKLWAAIQNDRGPVSSKLRVMTVTMLTTQMVLSAVIPALKAGAKIEKGSIVHQLLTGAEREASLPEGDLVNRFQEDPTLQTLDEYIQNMWHLLTISAKFDEEAEG